MGWAMQRIRTGFGTAFLAVSIQAAALVSSTAFADDLDARWWEFDPSSDEFVLPDSLDARTDAPSMDESASAEGYVGGVSASYTPGFDASLELLNLFEDAGYIDTAWGNVAHSDFIPA